MQAPPQRQPGVAAEDAGRARVEAKATRATNSRERQRARADDPRARPPRGAPSRPRAARGSRQWEMAGLGGLLAAPQPRSRLPFGRRTAAAEPRLAIFLPPLSLGGRRSAATTPSLVLVLLCAAARPSLAPACPTRAARLSVPSRLLTPRPLRLQTKKNQNNNSASRPSRGSAVRPIASSGKTDITKVGLNSIENDVVKSNLMGKSRVMGKKGWVDPQGRKGKGYGVYKVRD